MLVGEEVLDSMRTILLMLGGGGGMSNLSILPLFFFFLGWVTTAQPDVFTYDAKPILGNSLATSTSSTVVMSQ